MTETPKQRVWGRWVVLAAVILGLFLFTGFFGFGLGIKAVGVVADVVRPEGYARFNLTVSEVRELPSTAFTIIDLISGRQPTFLGETLPIFPRS